MQIELKSANETANLNQTKQQIEIKNANQTANLTEAFAGMVKEITNKTEAPAANKTIQVQDENKKT